jgi:hypothetical protein
MRLYRSSVVPLGLLLIAGCGAGSPARRGPTEGYAQSLDSASAACRQNPAYCTALAGEEAVVPLQVRAAAQVAAAGKAWAALEESERKGIEAILKECAQWAHTQVNRKEFGEHSPTQQQCDEQVGGTAENPITRRMRLGSAKHTLAVQCTKEKLEVAYPGRFSLEQRYRLSPDTRKLERISHKTELEMLRNGGKELVGSVVPDVVIHTGNPLQVQWVYDFKFPCPESNSGSWRQLPPGNPHKVQNQGDAYKKVFDAPATLITPKKASP